ncbi:MAG: hypothetical protein ACRDSH_21770 [Pseudonocardiaceae bacterium]
MTALVAATTLVQATQAVTAHLTAHPLPEPAVLEVMICLGRPEVRAQMRSHTVAGLTIELLAWADTLSAITIQAWRIPTGDQVQLSITSTLTGPTGPVALYVYGGASEDPMPFADLALGERHPLTVGELRRLAAGDPVATRGGELA